MAKPRKSSRQATKRKQPLAASVLAASVLTKLPHRPGVYRFLDQQQKTLYVGKAKDLAKRVRSYFRRSAQPNPRLQAMLRQVADLAYTEVDSEIEAIILETNFIKELQPKYNILMRDDKSHLYLKITLGEDFPRIYRIRNPKRDPSAKIFGPFTSSDPLQALERVFRRLFPYRTCHLDIQESAPGQVTVKPKTRHLPCLLYHIKRCLGPCIAVCDKAEYRAMIERVILFLEGKTDRIASEIQAKMRAAV
ncbi:MAG: GIY-YIG nuclease family protein, partial [Anaerolineales bacterium]|nr:GIY-YIG nuclease family protein [Anaerolineales bacterium]